MNNIYIKSFFLLILIYVGITVVIYFYQRKLLYHPFSTQVSGEGLIHNFETINFKTSDNLLLKGWFHLKNSKKKTILFFHGNAGNLDNRIDKLNSIGNMDVNFLIIAWRGFSGNPGKPSEEGLYKDALGGIKWLNEKGISNDQIVLYGESLGTAIATEVGQNNNFAGIILEAPFTSMVDTSVIRESVLVKKRGIFSTSSIVSHLVDCGPYSKSVSTRVLGLDTRILLTGSTSASTGSNSTDALS